MLVRSEEQGVQFEWDGAPATVVRVGLAGPRDQAWARLELLQRVVQEQAAPGGWTDLELRERLPSRGYRPGSPIALVWAADFPDERAAAACFTVLCHAVGMAEDGVPLEIET